MTKQRLCSGHWNWGQEQEKPGSCSRRPLRRCHAHVSACASPSSSWTLAAPFPRQAAALHMEKKWCFAVVSTSWQSFLPRQQCKEKRRFWGIKKGPVLVTCPCWHISTPMDPSDCDTQGSVLCHLLAQWGQYHLLALVPTPIPSYWEGAGPQKKRAGTVPRKKKEGGVPGCVAHRCSLQTCRRPWSRGHCVLSLCEPPNTQAWGLWLGSPRSVQADSAANVRQLSWSIDFDLKFELRFLTAPSPSAGAERHRCHCLIPREEASWQPTGACRSPQGPPGEALWGAEPQPRAVSPCWPFPVPTDTSEGEAMLLLHLESERGWPQSVSRRPALCNTSLPSLYHVERYL